MKDMKRGNTKETTFKALVHFLWLLPGDADSNGPGCLCGFICVNTNLTKLKLRIMSGI